MAHGVRSLYTKYLYIYARANCASRSLNFVNKNKNTCVSDNNPFTGKRMGRHQYQTAFINIKNRWSKILVGYVGVCRMG